ncbi:xylulokinase [Jiangella asiatica]|uniref:Xylulose kinase n=1 Tax=Jiangella asiatica TaxID=2530372 RepID=A0A4R5CNG6_9ACTN|nr:FGGY family carbohydrate kinase [Jiangella asiatica]TDD99923.1 xylulose kinase [Jiangella asiatica]
MTRYIIGLDNGTTSARAKLYDLDGAVVAEASQEYECEYSNPGWVDQDITMLDEANLTVLHEIVRSSGVDPLAISSLGLSTQRGLHLYVDDQGRVLRNGRGLSWQDARHPKQLDQLRSDIGEQRFYAITGLPISAFWPIGKILWMQQNEPEEYAKANKILTTQEYFLRQLSDIDDWCIDWSNASLTGLMDVERLEWSQEILDAVGIRFDQLPRIVPSGRQVGIIRDAVAGRTGLPVGLPISTGGGDQQCAGIGAGVIEPGLCELTIGTAGNSVAYLDRPVSDPQRVITRSVHATPEPVWEAEGIQAAAGAAYRWFRDNIGYLARYIEPFTRIDPYVILDRLAARSPCGANGLIFHPYLAGSMTPHYDEHARGGFLGLTLKHDLGDLARAVLEGVAYEAREVLAAYDAMGLDLKEIRLAGGATKSDLWCQIQADIYGKPTSILQEGECAVLGAAILGAVGAGIFVDVESGVASMVHVKQTYQPDPGRHERYSELWKVFGNVYEALKAAGVYRSLSAAQQH